MTADQYLAAYQGQSLLYNTKDPALRGQCVQSVCFYVANNGFPVIWADAAEWWYSNQFSDRYERIANSATAMPLPGDIIIWDRTLSNSGGAGHIAVCLKPLPGTGTFISIDQNWGGKTVHTVVHNYDKVVGWLRFKRPAAPTPVPTPPAALPTKTGDSDMSITRDDVIREYRVNRGVDPSEAEIAGQLNGGNMKSLSFGFEAENNARRAAIDNQLTAMQNTINSQNQTLADFQLKLNDATASNADKQKALDETMATLNATNAQLTTAHDELAELQARPAAIVTAPSPAPSAFKLPAWLVGILATLTKWKTKA